MTSLTPDDEEDRLIQAVLDSYIEYLDTRGGAEFSAPDEIAHTEHVAEVESRHPKFGAFLRRATEDPEVREAYYAAQSRRDGEDDGN